MFRKNILANYIGTFVIVVLPVLALPWYLSILGPKQFGLISFVTTLQAFLGLLESGLSQTSVREFSVRINESQGDSRGAATLLLCFERIYVALAVGAGFVTLLFSSVISTQWLIMGPELAVLGKEAVCGAAIIFAAQFPGALYRSLLSGAQAQITLNGIMVSGLFLRHVGGILLLLFLPSLLTYLIWQCAIALLETSIRGLFAWKVLRIKRRDVRWESSAIRPVLFSVAKLSGAVLMGAITTQMDKIILSRMVPIEQFGYYAIASTVALGVLNMIYPLVQAISPRMMQACKEPITLRFLNIKLTKMIAGIVALGVISFLLGGEWFLRIWLRNAHTATMVHPLLSVLLIGSALNAFYHVGYFNWLANEKTNRIFLVNSLSLALCLLLTPWLINWQGPIGATFGFVAMNMIGFVISLEWVKKTTRISSAP